MTTHGDVFGRIYRDGVWYQGSGSGSDPRNTGLYRHFLQAFMHKNGVTSVLDLGCGDWQSTQLIDWNGISYLGVDVVASVIQANIANHGSANVRFRQLDPLTDSLPNADLLIIKDVLQHWPNAQIQQIQPCLASFPCALITDTRESYAANGCALAEPALNSDIEPGSMRPLDLSRSPFCWPVKEVFRHTSRRWMSDADETKVTVLYKSDR